MGITNFPNGVSSFGIPLFGNSVLPSTQGNIWHVKPISGNNGNDGKTPSTAFKTVLNAYNQATNNNNDIILLYSEGNTGSATTDYLSTALTWSKNCTHLVGVAAPTRIGQRARIAQTGSATGVTGLLTVTGHSNIFANFTIFQGVADATSTNAITVNGGLRNYFYNVNIQGNGSDTMAGVTNNASLYLTAAEENTFERCTIGIDTIGQSASTQVRVATDSRDNIFDDCLFVTHASGAGHTFVQLDADSLLGFLLFKNCTFINSPNAVGALTSMTLGIGPSRALTAVDGVVLLNPGCSSVGVTDMGVGGAVYGLGIGATDQTATDLYVSEALA